LHKGREERRREDREGEETEWGFFLVKDCKEKAELLRFLGTDLSLT